MPSNYVERIRKYDWEGLRSLWRQIEMRSTQSWTDGKALEHLVLRSFELGGATVQWPYKVRLADEPVEQIDGAVHFESLSCLVECKDTVEKVNVEPIAKLRNQLLRRHASSVGLLFSTGGFTESALTLAQYLAPQSVLLWTGGEIAFHLDREDFCSALLRKHRHSIETGYPNYDMRRESR